MATRWQQGPRFPGELSRGGAKVTPATPHPGRKGLWLLSTQVVFQICQVTGTFVHITTQRQLLCPEHLPCARFWATLNMCIISLNLRVTLRSPLYRPGLDLTEVSWITGNQAEPEFESRALALCLSTISF